MLDGVRIMRVSTVPYFVVTQLSGQLEFLRDLGAEVTVVCSPGAELERIPWGDGLHAHALEIPRKLDPVADLRALFQLWALFRRERPAIVHSTTPKAGLLSALAARLARVPIRLHTFTGQPWATLSGPMRWVARLADGVIGRLNTRCYADSPSQCRFLVGEGVIPAGQINVLGEGSVAGVDLARFAAARLTPAVRAARRRALGLTEEGCVIAFVGRITRDKGMGELLDAFATLVAAGCDVDLLLIGPVDDEDGATGRFHMERLKARPRVHALGYSAAPEHVLALANFLCLPSYREGFGTVVIEAAALGLPTLGTSIVGLVDAIQNEVTGVLVPPRDAVALTRALERLVSDPRWVSTLGAAARCRAEAVFAADVVNRRMAEEYDRLLGAGR